MAKDGLFRMSWYPADYLSDVRSAEMTLEEHGAFFLLVQTQWLHSRIPLDLDSISKLIRVSRRRVRSLWPKISDLFAQDADGYFHEGLEVERQRALATREERRAAGKKGGKAKQKPSKSQANAQANAKQKLKQRGSESELAFESEYGEGEREKSVHQNVPPAVVPPSRVSSNKLVAMYQQAWKTRYGSLPAGVDYRKLASQLKRIKATKEASDEEMAQSFLRFASDEDDWVIGCKHSVGAYTARVDSYFGLNHTAAAPQTNLGRAVAYTRKLMEEEKNGNPH